LIIFSSCSKQDSIEKDTIMDDLPNATEFPIQALTTVSAECKEYQNFKELFCFFKTAEKYPPPVESLTVPPANFELYDNRKLTIDVEGKTITATLLRNTSNEFDFQLEIDNEIYVLTKSKLNFTSNVKPIEVSKYMNSLYLIEDLLLEEDRFNNIKASEILGSGNTVEGTFEDGLTMTIGNESLIPSQGADDLVLSFSCTSIRNYTINRFINVTGLAPNTTNVQIVDAALDQCNAPCDRGCVDPMCVLQDIYQNVTDQEDRNSLMLTFLEEAMGMSLTEAVDFLPTFAPLGYGVFAPYTPSDYCNDFNIMRTATDALIADNDFLLHEEVISCDGTVLDNLSTVCAQIFTCNFTFLPPHETTGIRCLNYSFAAPQGAPNINVYFGTIWFYFENLGNCNNQSCATLVTNALNSAQNATQTYILDGKSTQYVWRL